MTMDTMCDDQSLWEKQLPFASDNTSHRIFLSSNYIKHSSLTEKQVNFPKKL